MVLIYSQKSKLQTFTIFDCVLFDIAPCLVVISILETTIKDLIKIVSHSSL